MKVFWWSKASGEWLVCYPFKALAALVKMHVDAGLPVLIEMEA